MIKKTVCMIDFNRTNGEQVLKLSVVPEIENFFKTTKTVVSEKYKDLTGTGIKFYAETEKLEKYTQAYRNSPYNGVSLDEYGCSFFRDGKANFSILRSVGLSVSPVTVIVSDLISNNDIQAWSKELAQYIKFLYASLLEKTNVRISINMLV